MSKLLLLCLLIVTVVAASATYISVKCIAPNDRCYAMGIKCCNGLSCNRFSKNHGKCS
nr:venom peptide [Acharia stimulea]